MTRMKPVVRVADVVPIPGDRNGRVKYTGLDRIYDLRASKKGMELWTKYFSTEKAFRSLPRAVLVEMLDETTTPVALKNAESELRMNVGLYFHLVVSSQQNTNKSSV